MLTVWRAAARRNLVQRPNVEDVRVIRVRLPLPQCYTLDETPRLVAAAETLPGTLGDGMPMADDWPAMIRIAWETGLRLSDLFRVDVGMVHRGILTMRSSKTDTLTAHELTTETLVALVALERLGHRKPTLGWPHDEWLARRHFDAIAEPAEATSSRSRLATAIGALDTRRPKSSTSTMTFA